MNRADHRAGVVAAVARHAARVERMPAGHYALSAQHPHVVGAGASLACLHCSARVTAPIPRLDPKGYSQACESFVALHRACEPVEPPREGMLW